MRELIKIAAVRCCYSCDSGIGRRPNRDPLPDAERIEGPNLFQYVQNNPLNLIDPLGLGGFCSSRNLTPYAQDTRGRGPALALVGGLYVGTALIPEAGLGAAADSIADFGASKLNNFLINRAPFLNIYAPAPIGGSTLSYGAFIISSLYKKYLNQQSDNSTASCSCK